MKASNLSGEASIQYYTTAYTLEIHAGRLCLILAGAAKVFLLGPK